jgi:predicted ATPase/DNA-binding CsgD family transcriptional regulator
MPDTPRPAPKNSAGDPGSVARSPGASEGGRTPPSNLPIELSSFVGRGREVAEIGALLSEHRLLTLTGPGGSGKTRLALRVASGAVEGYEEGVWLVELTPLTDPELVPQAVASVLGVRESPERSLMETLAAHLGSKTELLVLDNCEHLVGACASLAEALLGRCPNLSVLATSREALGAEGEALFVVPSLSLPDPRRLPAADGLPDYEAARLFAERARAVRPTFEVTEQNAMAVAQVCHRLDGMPLAIELAAARVKALSVEQISSRLDDRFALLTGGGRTVAAHHWTLRATMDWSHDLLSEEEKVLFRRLSVFAGGFTLEAAEEVCAGGGTNEARVLDPLASLVDKSLVLFEERDGEPRYRLLETVGQYASGKLEAGEAERLRKRHAEYYLKMAEEAEPDLGKQGTRLRRLAQEHDNFRAALGRALGPEASAETARLGLGMAVALGYRRFWAVHGLGEGLGWLERGLARGDEMPAALRAEALNIGGWMANVLGDYAKAVILLEESLALSRGLGDERAVAASLVRLGQLLAMHGGDRDRVDELCGEAEALLPGLSGPPLVAPVLVFLGMAALVEDDHGRARASLEEGLALFRGLGDMYGVAVCCATMGFVALREGDTELADPMFGEALAALREVGDRAVMLHCLTGEASVLALRGDAARAARLWGAAEALGEAASVSLLLVIGSRYDREGHVAAARSRLGGEKFAAAWAEGRRMTPEEAVEYALDKPLAPEQTDAPPAYPAGLSAREAQILGLLAAGLTNAKIAEELYISPRTVNAHLRSVYHKIGSSTRAEAARFASEHDLL